MLRASAFGLFAALLIAAPVHAVTFMPYEASYDLSLLSASGTIGPRAMDGILEQRVTLTCGGWETRSRVLLTAVYRDDVSSTNERIFTSWESQDGTQYRFAVQTRKNDIVVEAFKGTAKLGPKGGEVTYEAPVEKGKKVRVPLPRDTFLPLSYARALVDHAVAGDVLFSGVVLNGASSHGPRILSTAIGLRDPQPTKPTKPELDSNLLSGGWRMSFAFFNLFEKSDTPIFETVLRQHESGVVDEITQTFSDFTIAAHLTRLKKIPAPACARG